MSTAGATIRYAEYALHATNCAADTRADRSTDRTTDRTGCTIAFTRTLVRATLHASEYALRVRQIWNGKKGQRGGCGCGCELKSD
jgi:hypothetical protein